MAEKQEPVQGRPVYRCDFRTGARMDQLPFTITDNLTIHPVAATVPKLGHAQAARPKATDEPLILQPPGKKPPKPSYLVAEEATEEIHYSIDQLALMWNKSRSTVYRLVRYEPGVLKIKNGPEAKNYTYSVPKSVARRIHMRWSA